MMVTRDPEQLVSRKADNYRRWFGSNWAFIEKGGETKAGEWTKASEARLKKFVDYGHRLGYFVSVYCLDGYSERAKPGMGRGLQLRLQGEGDGAVAGRRARPRRLHLHRPGGRRCEGREGQPLTMAIRRARWKRLALKPVHTWIGIIAGGLLAVIGVTGSVIVFRADLERAALPRSGPATGHTVGVDESVPRSHPVASLRDNRVKNFRTFTRSDPTLVFGAIQLGTLYVRKTIVFKPSAG